MDCYQLQTLSSFSFGQSSIEADSYVDKLIKYGYQGGGLADINSASSFPYFDQAISKTPLIPFYGTVIDIHYQDMHLKGELIIEQEEGYLNLIKLINLHKDSYELEDLKEYKLGLGLILKTEEPKMKEEAYLNSANTFFYELSHIYEDFFFGIEIYSKDETDSINVTRKYIKEHSYNSLAFPKVIYLDKENGYKSYLMLNAIIEKKTISKDDLLKGGPFFLLTPHIMETIYSSGEVLEQSLLAKKIHFTFMKKRGKVLLSGENDSYAVLKEKAVQGLKSIFKGDIPVNYAQRLDYELNVINSMNFCDYFLIVQDYVNFAIGAGIKVGPGRGSAAGSLVSFSLGITKVDPIKYGLYFERFLNPLRVTMPDIDIDFEDDRRTDVINYLRVKYGANRVGLIITYSTLQLRASIRNIGTIFNLPDNRIDSLSKCISSKSKTFQEEYNSNYRFKKMASDPYYSDIISLAKLVLNYPVNTSIHASGVILSQLPIGDSVPFNRGEETNIVGFEYSTLEKMGFLKMDILALNYLTFISNIEKNIIQKDEQIPNIYSDLNNKEAYSVLCQGLLVDVFQLESEGIGRVVSQMQPTSIDDISAVIALYRPGPMENISTYINRKNLKTPYSVIVPQLKSILEETYGIIIYQEQILSIAKQLAGFDGGKADLFRRAIAKKDIDKMNALKEDFIKGCLNNSISKDSAEQIFELIVKFANYGFNKSHSYAYAFITYSLAYYKANYPWAFYLASLSKTSLGDDKSYRIIQELYHFSYSLVNPSINQSSSNMTFNSGRFLLGFNDIRGVSDKISGPILKEREQRGPFKSLSDFFFRVDLSDVSSRDLESLIDAGCFDEFKISRKNLKEHMDDLKMVAKFATSTSSEMMPYMEKSEEGITKEEFLNEYQALGSVVSTRLKNLIKGEKKYDTLYLVLDNPLTLNDQVKIPVTNGFIKQGLFYRGSKKVSKYDIISANADTSSRYSDQISELNIEESK